MYFSILRIHIKFIYFFDEFQIDQEFELLFVGKGDQLYEKWPSISKKLVTIAEEKIKHRDTALEVPWSTLNDPGET